MVNWTLFAKFEQKGVGTAERLEKIGKIFFILEAAIANRKFHKSILKHFSLPQNHFV